MATLIPLLTTAQAREAVDRVAEHERRQLTCDLLQLDAVVRALNAVAVSLHEGGLIRGIINLNCAAILSTCRYRVLDDVDLNCQLGIAVGDVWLSHLGWRCTPTPASTRILAKTMSAQESTGYDSDLVINNVRAWVVSSMYSPHFRALLPTAELVSMNHPQAFIAGAMTRSTDPEIEQLKSLSEQIGGVLAKEDILCFQPLVHHDPRVYRKAAEKATNRALNEGQLSSCVLAIILAQTPAIGLGIVENLAERYGCKILLIVDDGPVTPMITGADPAPTILVDGPDLVDRFRQWLSGNLAELRELAQTRADLRARALRQQAALRRRLDNEGDLNPAVDGMSPERVSGLLSDPDLYLGATTRELWILSDRYGPRPKVELDALQIGAFTAAWRVQQWDSGRAQEVLDMGYLAIARAGKQLMESREVSFWIDLGADWP